MNYLRLKKISKKVVNSENSLIEEKSESSTVETENSENELQS